MKIATKVKSILGALALGSVCMMNASAEYVCSVTHSPKSTPGMNGGNYGFLYLTMSTGPKCTGTILAPGKHLCTEGAIGGVCSNITSYSENSLLAVFKELNEAAKSGTVIKPSGGSCKDPIWGNNYCVQHIQFNAQ